MISWGYLRLFGIILCMAVTACAVAYESIVMAVVGFAVALPIVYISGKKSKETGEGIEDERTRNISQRSALLAYSISAPAMGIATVILLALCSEGDWMYYSGRTLSVAVMLLVAIFMSSYLIIDRGMRRDG